MLKVALVGLCTSKTAVKLFAAEMMAETCILNLF